MAEFNESDKKIRKSIMDSVLADGVCPPVADIAKQHSISTEELQKSLRNLETGICIALQNKSHEGIKEFQDEKLDVPVPELGEVFFARPFATFKNHYPISVNGKQKWYAECAVEGCCVSAMFPGKEVVLQSICRQTKEQVELVMRDGKIIEYSPKTLRVQFGFPFRYMPDDFVGWCDFNSFFSSEEAVNEWKQSHPSIKGVTRDPVTISNLLEIVMKNRLDFSFQTRFPFLKLLLKGNRCGITKQWPIFKYFLVDPFFLPTPAFMIKMNFVHYSLI